MTSYLYISQGCSTSRRCVVIPVTGQLTNEPTYRALEVIPQVAAPGAKSAVYDCLVYFSNDRGGGVGNAIRRVCPSVSVWVMTSSPGIKSQGHSQGQRSVKESVCYSATLVSTAVSYE